MQKCSGRIWIFWLEPILSWKYFSGLPLLECSCSWWIELAKNWSFWLSKRYWGKNSLFLKKFQVLLIFFFFQGPVIENISFRCGGFLKSLSLRGCKSVGDQSLRTLAQHCHNIEHLDLSECKKITDLATIALSRYCSKLASINLDSCSQISDSSLKAVSDGCPVRPFSSVCEI